MRGKVEPHLPERISSLIQLMKPNQRLDPLGLRPFGMLRIMLEPHEVTHLVQQSRRL